MITFTRLFSLSLALLVSASQGVRYSVAHGNTREVQTTEVVSISNAALVVDQKESVGVDEVPNQPPPETVPTAVNGRVDEGGYPPSSTIIHPYRYPTDLTRTRGAGVRNRPGAVEDYVQLFAGTGTSPSDRGASIHGTAYLTHTLVTNATYNVKACLGFCSSVQGCILYYESNLKCAVYGNVHTAVEKTNFGFEYVLGPIKMANVAEGNQYDDPVGGSCTYFNIFGDYNSTDEWTTTFGGDANLQITSSRGYRRIPVAEPQNLVVDGGFEDTGCAECFCYTQEVAHWVGISDTGGFEDATVFHHSEYACNGNGVGLLGSATGSDSIQGTLRAKAPLATIPGFQYRVTFYHSRDLTSPEQAAGERVDVIWNGVSVLAVRPGFSQWEPRSVIVTAVGLDTLL
ncbi:hypothetical protein FA15DRAFT_682590 [Coprinopsis marcescibilis]|uniref:Apple domain-containing protein n=1 Tax=Coprinopsis marcescibilis TaxID=230819 RepID=A0A5C3KJP3_COPMA|nr:hypothetical protein FA15DRAFT_682590 [Coprinopsis marcescibilis]